MVLTVLDPYTHFVGAVRPVPHRSNISLWLRRWRSPQIRAWDSHVRSHQQTVTNSMRRVTTRIQTLVWILVRVRIRTLVRIRVRVRIVVRLRVPTGIRVCVATGIAVSVGSIASLWSGFIGIRLGNSAFEFGKTSLHLFLRGFIGQFGRFADPSNSSGFGTVRLGCLLESVRIRGPHFQLQSYSKC